ncbi:MAG: arginyltransferase [Alphaproteobacteria bacterium]|nr:arginyltransferase [Alphaproteobacteria bacterium]
MTNQQQDPPQFFMTAPNTCGYLPDKVERKVFTHLVGMRAAALNDLLTQAGFRRSQTIAYRPACDQCSACVSVRVPVDEFEPSRNMKRVLEANSDLVGLTIPNKATSEQYSLFRSYLGDRHSDGGMIDMSVLDFSLMIEDSHVDTTLIEYRRRGPDTFINGRGTGPLIATALTDILSDGLSMVYSFFDPELSDRSLGTYMILDHIQRTKKQGLPYLYLGYWINGSKKMDYKARFKPQERLGLNGWMRVE